MWNGPLLNDVSPGSALVSPTGQVVTFDNWHSAGFGVDVVVIYDARGNTVRSMSLGDFLPEDYVYALPRSVSSLEWSGEHRLSADGKRVIVQVVVPDEKLEEDEDLAHYLELKFDLATGQRLPGNEKAWAGALAAATKTAAKERVIEAKQKARFIAPLTAPRGDDPEEWSDYLREAFDRVDPLWEKGFPARVVLIPSPSSGHADSLIWFRRALAPESKDNVAVMLASPSQDYLLAALRERTAQLASDSLKGVRIYVAVDDAHTEAVAEALAPTGATYIQLDPTHSIEQRKQRLE